MDVLTSYESQNQHFNAYYHDNAILIQFIVSELVIAAPLIEKLKFLTDKCLKSKIKLNSTLDSLFHSLNTLVGTLSDHDKLAFSFWTKGPLTRLKEYSEQYYRNESKQNTKTKTLHLHVYTTWLCALNILEQLNALKIDPQQTKTTLATIKQAFDSLYNCLNDIVKLMPRIFSDYTTNEQVLFFLLRKKEQLTDIYGATFVNKLLKAKKKTDLLSLLMQSFKEKGFENILSLITTDHQK